MFGKHRVEHFLHNSVPIASYDKHYAIDVPTRDNPGIVPSIKAFICAGFSAPNANVRDLSSLVPKLNNFFIVGSPQFSETYNFHAQKMRT